jgi:hypothetical protein
MDRNVEVVIGTVLLVVMCLAAFAVYRWWEHKRVRLVEKWVKDYLFGRYRELPKELNINCSHDLLWPVLVAFEGPGTGIHHRLQFACSGPRATWELLSEKQDE